jgi:uncharacterized protein with HEPN domain
VRDDRGYLEYIRESINLVDNYVQGSKDLFFSDSKTQDAVLRRLETLADAAAHLPDDLKQRHQNTSRCTTVGESWLTPRPP